MSDTWSFPGTSGFLENLETGAGNWWDEVLSAPKRGLNYLAALDPFNIAGGNKLKLDRYGNVSSPTIEESITPAFLPPPEEAESPIAKAVKLASPGGQLLDIPEIRRTTAESAKAGVGMATDPIMGLMASAIPGTAFLPMMAKDMASQGGDVYQTYQNEGFSPNVQRKLGAFLPTLAMTAFATKGAMHEVPKIAGAIPEIPLGESGYTTRSPINLDPGPSRPIGPILGTSVVERGITPESDLITLYSGGGSNFATPDPARAASYPGEVVKVTVPRSVYEAGKAKAAELGQPTPTDTYLPSEVFRTAKPAPEAKADIVEATELPAEDLTSLYNELGIKEFLPREAEPVKAIEETIPPGEEIDLSNLGPKPIELGQAIDKTSRALGWQEDPFANLRSKVVEPGVEETKPVLTENAKTLRDIIKATKTTKFTPDTLIANLEKAGLSSESLRVEVPKLLNELEQSGYVNKKATGTYTFNMAPVKSKIPSKPLSPMGPEGMSLEDALSATKKLVDEGKSLGDIEKIKADLVAKPVSAMIGSEAAKPLPTQTGEVLPPSKPPKPPTPKEPIPKRPPGYKEVTEKSLLDDITDLPKTLKSSFDISFGGRQGLFLLNRPEGLKALGKGLKSGKESTHLKTRAELENRPNKDLYKKFGLNQIEYDPTEPTAVSEFFPSKMGEKIPGVKQSQRIYNDQSNLMRADIFDSMTEKFSKAGKTPETHPELYKGLAKYLNVLTGRDPLPKKLAQAGYILNKAFWSPQFVKSRLQLLNPAFYAKLPREVQKMAIRDVGGTVSVLGSVLTAAAYVAKREGKDVDFTTDPRHTDFGKLRVGKTRYDLFSGLAPLIRTAARITTSTKITPKGKYNLEGGLGLGRSTAFNKAPFGATAGSELGGLIEGKTSPAYQIGKGLLTGKGWMGKPYNAEAFATDLAAPMGIMDMLEAAGYDPQDLKSVPMEFWESILNPSGLAKGTPSLLGVGVQTYQERKPKGSSLTSSSSQFAF